MHRGLRILKFYFYVNSELYTVLMIGGFYTFPLFLDDSKDNSLEDAGNSNKSQKSAILKFGLLVSLLVLKWSQIPRVIWIN